MWSQLAIAMIHDDCGCQNWSSVHEFDLIIGTSTGDKSLHVHVQDNIIIVECVLTVKNKPLAELQKKLVVIINRIAVLVYYPQNGPKVSCGGAHGLAFMTYNILLSLALLGLLSGKNLINWDH